MTTDAEVTSENAFAAGEAGGQGQVREPSVAPPPRTEASAASAAPGAASPATSSLDEGEEKAGIAPIIEPFVESGRISSTGEKGIDNRFGESRATIASPDPGEIDPLGDALTALERRDYSTAQRLFEALGRKDAADGIKDALAALDRRDYAAAQGLFDALSLKGSAAARAKGSAPPDRKPLRSAAAVAGRVGSGSGDRAKQELGASKLEFVPSGDDPHRKPAQGEKTKARGSRRLLLGTGMALFAILGASAIHGSPLNWTYDGAKNRAIAGLASAVDVLKAPLEAIKGPSEEERSAMRDVRAALTQATVRLDRIEQEYGARLDRLGQRIDQDTSSPSADIAARLDSLEKRAATPVAPGSEYADVAARLDKLEKKVAAAAGPAPGLAEISTRLGRLEKSAAVAAPVTAKTLPPAGPKPSTLVARAGPSASNEIAKPDSTKPLLRDYSIQDVQGGMAVVDSRYGAQQVGPGDFIPGAGRVLRIERRNGDWFVVTNHGVIASGQGPY